MTRAQGEAMKWQPCGLSVAAVACPKCGAPVGAGCRKPSNEASPVHQARHDAYARYPRELARLARWEAGLAR